MSKNVDEVIQFKITLNEIKPAIWRRIRVPADFSFGELSVAIMEAFDWTPGYHLHGYAIHPVGTKASDVISIGPPNPDDDWGTNYDEREVFLVDYFGKKIKQCEFTYDYGDSWDHTVLFEGVFTKEKGVTYPQLVAGKNATPPEDCGGVWGYEDLIRKLKNPKSREHGEILDWLGLDDAEYFDPSEFDPTEIVFSSRKEAKDFLKDYNGALLMG